MFWINTTVFKFLANFLQSIWAEPTGKIFLVTIIAYSISYIIYSGYIGWFTGGVGSMSISQIGFTAIDFLGLIPTVYFLLLQLAWKSISFLSRIVVTYILIPFLFLGIVYWTLNEYHINAEPYNTALTIIGIYLWMSGILIGLASYFESSAFSTRSVVVCLLAAFLIALSLSSTPNAFQSTPQVSTRSNIFNEITSIIFLLFIPFFPYYIGVNLASASIKEKFLSQIQKIVLTAPFEIQGMTKEKRRPTKNVNAEIFTYIAKKEYPIYLVATFSKTTAIYLSKEITGKERGKLVVIANDIIRALEIRSGKLEPGE